MKRLSWIAISILVTGCASQSMKSAKSTGSDHVKPSYDEKAGVVEADAVKPRACPADGAWEKVEWRKVIPMANACVSAKDWRKVELIGRHLGQNAPLTPWGAYYMSLAANARKDYPRAVWMIQLALKKAPKEGLFNYQLGRLHWEMEDDVAALQELEKAIELNPKLTDAQWIIGQIALKRGDHKKAERHLTMALEQNSKHAQALLAMASLRAKQKNWVDAESFLTRAQRVHPRDANIQAALNHVRENRAKMKAAEAPVKTVSTRAPTGEGKVAD